MASNKSSTFGVLEGRAITRLKSSVTARDSASGSYSSVTGSGSGFRTLSGLTFMILRAMAAVVSGGETSYIYPWRVLMMSLLEGGSVLFARVSQKRSSAIDTSIPYLNTKVETFGQCAVDRKNISEEAEAWSGSKNRNLVA